MEPRSIDDADIRKKARKRSWICPGAGFALVGSGKCAIATFVASLCIAPVVAWVAFRPTAASLWTTIAVLVVATVLWLAEQAAIKRSAIRTPTPSILDRGFVVSACMMWLAVSVAAFLLMTAFGQLRMGGSGMTPTLENGERLMYHKHIDWESVKPGAIIVYKNAEDSAWGQSGWIVISRILAAPGDDISIQNGQYVVNGAAGPPVADTGRYDVVLDVPSSPESLTVPNDCYFIVQDSPTGGFDSRVLSWVRADDIVGSRLWYFSRRGFFKPVK
jgi:signal peptidase I